MEITTQNLRLERLWGYMYKIFKNVFWFLITILQTPFFIIGVILYVVFAPIYTGFNIMAEADGKMFKEERDFVCDTELEELTD